MPKILHDIRPHDIRVDAITDNETWNNCIRCDHSWKDAIPSPGLLYRETYCPNCKEYDPMYQRPIHQKPIAVVANDVQSTMEWIRETYSSLVKDINLTTSRVTLTNGKVYQVITSAEQAKAWEFSDYMVAPHYSHLIDVVKSRIR